MKLKNIVIVVKDMEKSKAFYRELFGMQIVLDCGDNVIMTEGLVLQKRQVWEDALDKAVIEYSHAAALYFEEQNLDFFLQRQRESTLSIEYITKELDNGLGKRVLRLYDPDGHILEIGENKSLV